ncbi:MAG: sensor histidine kinase, partial [Planctomycetota bacterium]
LARVEAETGVPRAEALDLRDLAREARGALLSLAAEREMQILLELPAQPVPVRGDRIGLLTALTNLLDNALKYGPRGSPVRLAVSGQGGDAVVEVSDQGPGIPPHETERIFERFYRLDKNRSRDLGGTGLGLSIVRHVAASHGGRVFVLSSVGHGSTFRLAIPLQEDGRAGLSSEPAGAGPARSDAGSRPT